MSAYVELNIKEGMPSASDALSDLQASLKRFKQDKYKCILIIHGYGSTGKGGVIHDKARSWLRAQERNGKIKNMVYGEDFNVLNFKALALKNKYNELQSLLKVCNHGVTVVEI